VILRMEFKITAMDQNKYRKVDLQKKAQGHGLDLTYEEEEVIEGWYGKPKGMLQVQWEHGSIDETQLDKYRKTVLKGWKKDDGSIKESKKEEATNFVLDGMLARCQDFATEITHLKHVVEQIAATMDINIAVVHSVKYHCECAGLGVEYCFGYRKRYYRRAISPGDKKRDFRGSVIEAMEQVTKEHMRKFCYPTRRYLVGYIAFGEETSVEYDAIERFQGLVKTHRSAMDLDAGYIKRLLVEALQEEET
jgi:hypothetical protein